MCSHPNSDRYCISVSSSAWPFPPSLPHWHSNYCKEQLMTNPPSWPSSLLRWLIAKAKQLIGAESPMPESPAAPALGVQPVALVSKAYATVVIPALNEAKHISEVVAYALADPATAEVIVIDDSSIDSTAELARLAGAKVLTSSMLGKGASMHDGVAPAQCN